MPIAVDWMENERRAARRDPEYRVELLKVIAELLATGDDEDRRVAHSMARGLLELEFDSDEELLAQLGEPVAA